MFHETGPYTNFHDLNLDWILRVVKEFKGTMEGLDARIEDIVKKELNDINLGQLILDALTEYGLVINVKAPPADLPPAKGDGSVDDTITIQGCIDYAFSNGGKTVFFPSGKYLTQSLNLKNNVSLCGFDMKTTHLVLKGGAINPLLSGTSINNQLSGLTFDGNADIQVNNVDLITMTGGGYNFSNIALTDGYNLLTLNVTDTVNMDNVLFGSAIVSALVTNGSGVINASELTFRSLSTLSGLYIIDNKVNDAEFVGIYSTCITVTAIRNMSNGSVFVGKILNATNTHANFGANNYYEFYSRGGTNTDLINAERVDRENADDVLRGEIQAEALLRENADNLIRTDLTAESITREHADELLQTDIDSIKASRFYKNVKDFGVVGDSVANDTVAFQNAIDSMVVGGTLFVPAGFRCKVGTLNINKPINVVGNGANELASMMIALTDSTTIFNITSVGVNIEHLQFDSLSTQKGGSYIVLTGPGRGAIKSCYFGRFYIGITHNGTINQLISDCFFENGTSRLLAPGGCAMLIGSTTYTASPIIENCTVTSVNNVPDEAPDFGLCLKYVDGGFISNCSFIKQNMPLVMNPEASQFTHAIYVTNTLFDSSRFGCTMTPIGNAIVEIISFANCWFAGNSEMGLRALADTVGKVAGVNFTNCHFLVNAFGMYIGHNVDRMNVSSSIVAGNTNAGILVTDNAKNVVINGNNVGAFGDIIPNNAGVTLGGGCDYIIMTSNVVTGNTTSQITNGTTGTNVVNQNNLV